jgi:hypothetical protein
MICTFSCGLLVSINDRVRVLQQALIYDARNSIMNQPCLTPYVFCALVNPELSLYHFPGRNGAL